MRILTYVRIPLFKGYYVMLALANRGIPIPQSREGVEQLVGALNENKRKIKEALAEVIETDLPDFY